MHVVVLGAGVVGTATAWFLRAAGHQVTVLERQLGAGRETSLANGGQVSVSHAEPWANPTAPRKLLKWIGRSDAPLWFRPQPEVRQWIWGLAFLRECTRGRTEANVRTLIRLGLHSRATLAELRQTLGLGYARGAPGILHFYSDAADAAAACRAAAMMSALGCERRVVSADEAVALEPALAGFRHHIVGADFCAADESGDAHEFTVELAAHAVRAGVRFLYSSTVTRIIAPAGRVAAVEAIGSDGWPFAVDADAVVVSLGVHSFALLRALGIRLQLYPAKGYSATFDIVEPERAPAISLTDSQHKLVISRFRGRLRVAGTAEIGSHDLALNGARCEAIRRRAATIFPGACDYDRPQYWAGLRPATPSNVPYLGPTRIAGLFLNTGHGTLGWTLAAGCGQLIADVVSGRRPDIDLPPNSQSAL